MPRRNSARAVSSSATPQAPALPQQIEAPYDSNIRQLRRHWKWAAFSQFFFTFSPLFAMADVTLVDVENDLAHSTNRVLSRIMQRLLIILTQDRKITTGSWQNTLRRQYQRRDPEASPIGLISRSHQVVEFSRASTTTPAALSEVPLDVPDRQNESLEHDQSYDSPSPDDRIRHEGPPEDTEHNSVTEIEEEDTSPEGTEEQVDWLDLSMLVKLESMHALAEWQFQYPHRLRQQMKTDDEQAAWRIEPIGYDARRNAYWLIGGDRLWIQREPPRPNLKRKRKPGGNITKEKLQSSTIKRQRIESALDPGRQSVMCSTRSKAQSQLSPGQREGRAAKTRANQRLDAQARDLAEFRRQMVSSHARTTSSSPRKPAGIRVSARLRGAAVEDDEWQEVPEEWLSASNTHRNYGKDLPSGSSLTSKKKSGLESDDSSISELTELSDGENDFAAGTKRGIDRKPVTDTEEVNPTSDIKVKAEDKQDVEANLPDLSVTPISDDFVEWETVCVTLEEWESLGQQFEKATHYAERALHKVLTQSIVPMVTAEMRETEKKRRMEDAVVCRKRSSRIAMKEIEKEEERAAMRKRMEEEEKTSRARRLEARQQKEQMERLRRENAREQRRKERELREQQSAETHDVVSNKLDSFVDVVQQETSSSSLSNGHLKVPVIRNAIPINGTGSGSRSPVENWELDCEICGRKGINQDDGVPLLCCGACGKWQHIICHDNQDAGTGRAKRNWDTEDFVCRQCHLMTSKSGSGSLPSPRASNKREQASSSQAYYEQTSNPTARSFPRSSGYYQGSRSDVRYPHNHSDYQTAVSSLPSHSYTSQTPSTSVTFAHYQPQQGGFSTSRPTYTVQDANSPPHARYTLTPHTVSATGITSYPSTFHPQATTRSPTHVHDQWLPSSYPRTTNSYSTNSGQPLHTQGVQPYYNGHAHTSYSHMRGSTNSTVLGQYAGLQHVPSYQHSK